jgi:hypothetical protein
MIVLLFRRLVVSSSSRCFIINFSSFQRFASLLDSHLWSKERQYLLLKHWQAFLGVGEATDLSKAPVSRIQGSFTRGVIFTSTINRVSFLMVLLKDERYWRGSSVRSVL